MGTLHLGAAANPSRTPPRTERSWPGVESDWQMSAPLGAVELQQLGTSMRAHLGKLPDSAEIDPGFLKQVLVETRALFADHARLVSGLNALEAPGLNRDPAIGKAILPLIIWQFTAHELRGKEAQLYELYLRTHIDQETGESQISFPEYLSGLHGLFAIAPQTKELPEAQVYLQNSPSLGHSMSLIEGRLARLSKDLEETQAAAAKSKNAETYAIRIEKLSDEVQTNRAEIPALFNQLNDVIPESIHECVSALGVAAAAHLDVLNSALTLTQDIESVLVTALVSTDNKAPKEQALRIPRLSALGAVGEGSMVLSKEMLASLGKDPESLIQIIQTYLCMRAYLRMTLSSLDVAPDLAHKVPAIQNVLGAPFAMHAELGRSAMSALLRNQDVTIRELTLQILADKVFVNEGWAHSLEDSKFIQPLLWAVKCYLGSAASDREDSFFAALKDSVILNQNVVPLIGRVKAAVALRDFEGLARVLNDEIRASALSKNIFKLLAPLLVFDALVQDSDLVLKLKNKIPDLVKLKEFVGPLADLSPETRKDVALLTRQAVKGFGLSMLDYYRDPNMSELWTAIEKFKVVLRNPQCLDGLPGDKAMKSGVLLKGPYGAGKTFFVDCIANDLEIPVFSISPETTDVGNAEKGESLLSICQRKIAAAKKHAETTGACILFIDEAEVIMPNRGDPRISLEQKELTGFMLREISQIRLKYPKIMIVAATNYAEEIDGGITRPGRLDIAVEMNAPGPEMRKGMILETLAKERIALDLSPTHIESLIKATEGMMPLALVRSIFELNRIDRAQALEKGQHFEFTLELLLERYAEEGRYLKVRQEMLAKQREHTLGRHAA